MGAKEPTCGSCESDSCSAKHVHAGESPEQYAERSQLRSRLCRVRNKVLVMSGKGGVGKSSTAVNLALSLAALGQTVGILDVDIHGPSIPKLLDLAPSRMPAVDGVLLPVPFRNLKVMSVGFLLRARDEAVIWRGPLKMGVIKQFLKDVEWGSLDYLIIDCPPGTGDEPLSVVQLLEDVTEAVIVTTPQEVALLDVRRSITFCRQLKVPVVGVLENMSGFVCPQCGEVVNVFTTGGGETMAADMGVPFLGRIPLDPELVAAGDSGKPYVLHHPEAETTQVFARAAQQTLDFATAAAPEQARQVNF